jgi:uncharacterized membrane protein YgcG
MLRILISGFFDGAAVERRELTEPSRWELHSADRVQIEIGISNSSTSPSCPSLSSSTPSSSPVLSIDLLQLPRCLSSSKVGVGAVLWDGGIVLTAVLASLPPSALLGEVVVELGAGVGAPSLAAARRGARVVSTDKGAAVSGVLQKNVELNGLLSPSFKLPPEPGKVALRVLEFGTREGDEAAAALADAVFSSSESFSSSTSVAAATATAGRAVDLVLAADCVYSDGDGESPDPEDEEQRKKRKKRRQTFSIRRLASGSPPRSATPGHTRCSWRRRRGTSRPCAGCSSRRSSSRGGGGSKGGRRRAVWRRRRRRRKTRRAKTETETLGPTSASSSSLAPGAGRRAASPCQLQRCGPSGSRGRGAGRREKEKESFLSLSNVKKKQNFFSFFLL